ncbi:hypothetical protein LSAT2_003466 [Lamellibrachia satsuma]|nr:hypothetical protein LSAT2_003466 [Lamellibrachia satsuma]
MKSEEEQYISTVNVLRSSDAVPQDTGCTQADISQKMLSSNSQSPIGSPTCGPDASVSLAKQGSEDLQVLQGLKSVKSEDYPAETHSNEAFLQFGEKEPHIQVKSEKTEYDECNSSNGGARKWVVCEGVVNLGNRYFRCLHQRENLPPRITLAPSPLNLSSHHETETEGLSNGCGIPPMETSQVLSNGCGIPPMFFNDLRKLRHRYFDDHYPRKEIVVVIYRVVCVIALLYLSETWVVCRCSLKTFNQRCLRVIRAQSEDHQHERPNLF